MLRRALELLCLPCWRQTQQEEEEYRVVAVADDDDELLDPQEVNVIRLQYKPRTVQEVHPKTISLKKLTAFPATDVRIDLLWSQEKEVNVSRLKYLGSDQYLHPKAVNLKPTLTTTSAPDVIRLQNRLRTGEDFRRTAADLKESATAVSAPDVRIDLPWPQEKEVSVSRLKYELSTHQGFHPKAFDLKKTLTSLSAPDIIPLKYSLGASQDFRQTPINVEETLTAFSAPDISAELSWSQEKVDHADVISIPAKDTHKSSTSLGSVDKRESHRTTPPWSARV